MESAFDRIVPKDLKLDKLGEGYQPAEGPIWIHEGNYLIFSAFRSDTMYKWSEEKGIEIFRSPSGKANGNTLDKQGRLITCEHGNRQVSRTEPDGTIEPMATNYQGKKFNSPNDVVVKSDGGIYFTDPPFGLRIDKIEDQQELDYCGVFRYSPDTGETTLLADDFVLPNGLTFSLDESLLYINDSDKTHIRVFDVKEDGTITNGRVFAEVDGNVVEGRPDGMKVDREGNVYCTGKGGVWIFDPDGNHLGVIPVPLKCANFAWGGSDWKSFFMACFDGLFMTRLKTPGVPLP
jgi:sugar lactone lactonase YvrE